MKKNNRRLWLLLGGIGLYALTLVLLTLAESRDPNASIKTIGDAFWYSLVTMSTVGYGDMYPVTAAGKVLGIVFVLLSLGVLTFVITLLIRSITGKMLPALKLWRLRNRQWFVFSCWNEASVALAEDLRRKHPGCVILTPGEEASEGCLAYPGSMERITSGKKSGCRLFYMDGEYEKALAALSLGYPVYCLTELTPGACPEGLTLFDRYDCCARSYWQRKGLLKGEKTVLIVGEGKYAESLLTRALLTNVFDASACVRYHVFGDWNDFIRNHPGLGQTVLINKKGARQDSLYFHTAWNESADLLGSADRIILCGEDTAENLRVLSRLRRFFPIKGAVHIRAEGPLPGNTVFGMAEEIFTAELVMRQQLTKAARCMHEIYRSSTGGTAPAWEDLSEFLQQSNIAAADHLLIKLRLLLGDDSIASATKENCAAAFRNYQQLTEEEKEECRRIEHRRWMRFHSLYNWAYGQTRDNAARLHPLMVPYEELSPEEQAKDDYAWELLEKLAQNL